MNRIENVAIVGGGPAGAFCAFELARKGIYTTVFDHSHPREKPCGGGISALAIQKFPFLKQFRSMGGVSSNLRIISCTNKQVTLIGHQQGFNISRRIFDEELVKMATQTGAKLVHEKVINIQKKQNSWQIKTDNQIVNAKTLIGADGVNSLVRKKTIGAIPNKNLGLAYGYFVTGVEHDPTTIKFLGEIPGYIWIFPRNDHSCIGIGSKLKHGFMIKKLLEEFVQSYCPQINIASTFAAMFPCVTDPDFFMHPCAGEDWVLVGDAAGHVNPLSGEGILYALWSGKLAAEATAENELRLYNKLWREDYGNYLRALCVKRDAFYDPLSIELSIVLPSLRSNLLKS